MIIKVSIANIIWYIISFISSKKLLARNELYKSCVKALSQPLFSPFHHFTIFFTIFSIQPVASFFFKIGGETIKAKTNFFKHCVYLEAIYSINGIYLVHGIYLIHSIYLIIVYILYMVYTLNISYTLFMVYTSNILPAYLSIFFIQHFLKHYLAFYKYTLCYFQR